ncbi:MAG: HDIG domain-containing protein [Candidatus Wallbacteria bacterium]|nr:HDIG domain-containing protein [Candidatus Wallbacteria bacterium]
MLNKLRINWRALKTVRLMSGLFCFMIVYSLLLIDFKPTKRTPTKGETSPFDIVAPTDFSFEDKKETERFLQDEESRIESQFKKDPTVELKVEHNLTTIFKYIYEKEGQVLWNEYQLKLDGFKSLQTLGHKELLLFRNEIWEFLQKCLNQGIKEGGKFSDWETELPADVSALPELRSITERVFEPNLLYDREKTEQLRHDALSKVMPVFIQIRKGETLVRKGEVVTPQSFKIMKAIGLYENEKGTFYQKVGTLLFVMILAFIGYLYLSKFEHGILNSGQTVWMIVTLIILNMLFLKLFKLLLGYNISMENLMGDVNILSPAAFPLSISAIILTVLVDGRLAILVSVMLSTIAIYQLGASYYYVYYFLLGSFFSVFMCMNVNKTTELSKNGLFIGFFNVLLVITLYLIFENPIYFEDKYWIYLGRDVFWGFMNGILSVAFAIGFLPNFESVFKLSSAIRLLEFADLNQPLLKTLMLDAPGTYQHSVLVGNLAQAAAQVVGADPLLSKLGGYYHDIGKLKRPQLFMENQIGSDNQHDELSPNLSALIIAAHVKDGVEVGKAHRLPHEIIDIIAQHHGTTLLQYFYEVAKIEHKDRTQEVPIEQFRYPGPLPQTKESALVMLSDSVESATRSLDNPNASNIEALVKKVINDKFVEGQFNECDLTLKDIESIAKIFIKMIISLHHSRIKYPEQDKEVKKIMEQNGEV